MPALLVVFALLAGCSHGKPDPQSGGAPGAPPRTTVVDALPHGPVSVAWRRSLQPLMQPAVVGDVAVAVVRVRGRELDIVGLSVDDGRVLWRYPFYTPDAFHSAYFWPPVFSSESGKKYAVFQRADTGSALKAGQAKPYVAVDPETGRIVARTRPMVAAWHAIPCTATGADVDVCLVTGDERTTWEWRLDDFSLHRERDPHGAGKGGVYTVIGMGRSGIVTIGREAPGGRGWERKVSAVVGRHWVVDQRSSAPYVGHGVVVISAARRPTSSQEKRYRRGQMLRIDRGRQRTLGLDLKTGRVLWRRSGGELGCPSAAGVEWPVRCAFTGTFVFDKRWKDPHLDDVRLQIEGYDPRTGATRWSVALSPRAAAAEALRVYRTDQASDTAVVVGQKVTWLPTRHGPQAVAWSDGSRLSLHSSSVLLCEHSVHFGYATDDEPSWEMRETDTYRTCTAGKARSVSGPPSAAGLAIAGTPAEGGRYVVVFADRILAYRVA